MEDVRDDFPPTDASAAPWGEALDPRSPERLAELPVDDSPESGDVTETRGRDTPGRGATGMEADPGDDMAGQVAFDEGDPVGTPPLSTGGGPD